jgi:hypothetical protein
VQGSGVIWMTSPPRACGMCSKFINFSLLAFLALLNQWTNLELIE